MKMRNNWFRQEKQRTLEETAGALGFISWQIASERVRFMEAAGFYVDLPDRTLKVIAEYLIFISHVMDRLTYEQLMPEQRGELMSALAQKQANIYEDNRLDAKDESQSRSAFIDLINQRYADYAEYEFNRDDPSYSMYRYLAQAVCAAMGKEHERNVTEQVIEIEGPQCVDLVKKALNNLMPVEAEDESLD